MPDGTINVGCGSQHVEQERLCYGQYIVVPLSRRRDITSDATYTLDCTLAPAPPSAVHYGCFPSSVSSLGFSVSACPALEHNSVWRAGNAGASDFEVLPLVSLHSLPITVWRTDNAGFRVRCTSTSAVSSRRLHSYAVVRNASGLAIRSTSAILHYCRSVYKASAPVFLKRDNEKFVMLHEITIVAYYGSRITCNGQLLPPSSPAAQVLIHVSESRCRRSTSDSALRPVKSKIFLPGCGLAEGNASKPFASKAVIPSPSSSRDLQVGLPSVTGGAVLGKTASLLEGYQLRKSGKASL